MIPKNPTKESEDGIVVTDNFVAVVDGSTSKSNYRHSRNHSNGNYAMQIVCRYISKMDKATTCLQFCRGVTQAVARHYTPWTERIVGKTAPRTLPPADRLTASAIVFSRVQRQIWMVGDCQCLAGGEYYDNPKPYEALLAEHRAVHVQRLLADGMTPSQLLADDVARKAIIPEMLQTMENQNKTYSVIDGTPIPLQHVKIVTLDFQPWELVLASDGYPILKPTLAESEAALSRQREVDPLNIGTFKATKAFTPGFNSFDDRAYIRFRV